MCTVQNAPMSYPSGICTLFEGDYDLGLAAFLNSLVHADYSGTVWPDIEARRRHG